MHNIDLTAPNGVSEGCNKARIEAGAAFQNKNRYTSLPQLLANSADVTVNTDHLMFYTALLVPGCQLTDHGFRAAERHVKRNVQYTNWLHRCLNVSH
jgi:hypothetical protein